MSKKKMKVRVDPKRPKRKRKRGKGKSIKGKKDKGQNRIKDPSRWKNGPHIKDLSIRHLTEICSRCSAPYC